ncbi:hypothetical protein AMECASPLE_017379 [Ameca splendens]|uniref:Uncharacterized protein n=1 Tax=Ameca splendens TaxID=208324 RepID=A0ABV0Z0E1_9TELE
MPQQHHISFPTSVGAKVKTIKHTPPTRNHPADKQTPPQYKAEKPDATTEPCDARPAVPTLGGQSRCAQDHCPNTTTCHIAEDRMQQRAPKVKGHKAHTVQMCLHQPSKNKAPLRKCTPAKRRPTASTSMNMPDTHTPARSSPARKPTPKPTKGSLQNQPRS